MTRGEFAEAVFAYCCVTAGSVISGQRTSKRNAALKGVSYSAHLVNLAADVEYDSRPALDVRLGWAARLGLRLVTHDTTDHLQPADWIPG